MIISDYDSEEPTYAPTYAGFRGFNVGNIITQGVQDIANAGSSVVKGTENAVQSVASDVSSAVNSLLQKAFGAGSLAANTINGIIKLDTALAGMAGSIASAIASGNLSSIGTAFRSADPMEANSTAYHLISDPANEDAADILSAVMFSPLIAALTFNPSGLGILPAIANLTSRPSPYTKLLRDCVAIPAQKLGSTQLVGKLIDVGENLIQVMIGIPVGPATAFGVGILLLTNLPQPPYGAILSKIMNDPIAKKYMLSRSISATFVKKIIPDTIACMDADSAEEWVTCAEGVIDTVAPKFITNLKAHGLSWNDIRTVAGAAWQSGLDLDLMFDEDFFPGITGAMEALGIVGIVYLAQALNCTSNSLITKYFGPLNNTNIAKRMQQALHLFELAIQAEKQFVSYEDSVTSPTSFVASFLDAMNQSQWNLDTGCLILFGEGALERLKASGSAGAQAFLNMAASALPNTAHAIANSISTAPSLTQLGAATANRVAQSGAQLVNGTLPVVTSLVAASGAGLHTGLTGSTASTVSTNPQNFLPAVVGGSSQGFAPQGLTNIVTIPAPSPVPDIVEYTIIGIGLWTAGAIAYHYATKRSKRK